MITEKSNQLQVIVITDYDYPNSAYLHQIWLNFWKKNLTPPPPPHGTPKSHP